MHLIDGRPVFAATDLVGFVACDHLTQLERAALHDLVERPVRIDDEIEVLAERGRQHEARFLAHLREEVGRRVTEIQPDGSITDYGEQLRAAGSATIAAMQRGDDVIYQATFFDGTWRGHADFLLRTETPSALGSWSYEVADTKLARKPRASAILQMCSYTEHVTRIQDVPPARMHVALGGSGRAVESFRVMDAMAYYRQVKGRFARALETGDVAYPPLATYPVPVDHCAVCRWNRNCTARWRADDHLSLVAFMRGDQTTRLEDAGIGSVVALAQTPLPMLLPPERMSASSLERLQLQAALQVRGRRENKVFYQLLAMQRNEGGRPASDKGLSALPAPSHGDLFLDLEGDPYAEEDGLEFLFGVIEPARATPETGPAYHERWAHDRAGEKEAFEWFIDLVLDRRAADPDLHVYHYGAYEPTALKKLMGRHGTREAELDGLLRGAVFVDLYRVVRQGVRVSTESYSIKRLEPLYGLTRSIALRDAGSAVVKYERWIIGHGPELLAEVALYNQDDCLSAWKLRDWLEERRKELADQEGAEVPRPMPQSTQPKPELSDRVRRVQELAEALVDAAPVAMETGLSPAPVELLAHLLSWHRREDKADWWRWFELRAMTDDELVDQHDAIGELEYLGEGELVKRSREHHYRFDAQQEYRLAQSDAADDPATGKPAGTIHALDAGSGRLTLLRGKDSTAPHPRSLISSAPIDTKAQQAALMRMGEWVLHHGLDADGPYRAGRDLLLRRPPRMVSGNGPGALAQPGEDQADAARRLAALLDHGCLPIQGPPGSGKTFTGARMIVDLVRAGKRVGVTASSHKVISNLLRTACEYAAQQGLVLRAVQRSDSDDDWCDHAMVTVGDNAAVEKALAKAGVDVVAGTAWLWAREQMLGAVDTLFVDEAGQVSLANVMAICGATRNLVMLGDPQQLTQPSKGVHPPGAGSSALEHILEGAATIPMERGLFLATTWRLHPDLCAFTSGVFYDGKLEPQEHLVNQAILRNEPQSMGGTGIRFVEVHSEGARNASVEEARVVLDLVTSLLRDGRWRDARGAVRPLQVEDLLVVSPYNAQVALIRRLLGGAGLSGARVGTVDKFQGQEAPVVLYSMATSAPELAPRGMEFLYSLNRLNVATSRARALAVVIANGRLLEVRCRTPHQVRLANALCRAAELAAPMMSVALESGGDPQTARIASRL